MRSAREVSFTIRSESLVSYLPLIRSGWDEMNSAQLLLPVRPPRGPSCAVTIDPADDRALEMVAYGDGQPSVASRCDGSSVIWSMLLSREATCSFEADPRPVIACLTRRGAYSETGSPGSARPP